MNERQFQRPNAAWSGRRDLAAQSSQVEQHGATLFQDVPDVQSTEYYEKKYTDRDGIIFDITHSGWGGAKA